MKDFNGRVDIWKASKLTNKFRLWQVLDFEKMFEDENMFREKYAERLETFLDLINRMQKDLDEWEKREMNDDLLGKTTSGKTNPLSQKEKYKQMRSAR